MNGLRISWFNTNLRWVLYCCGEYVSMTSLLTALREATEPSRELDAEIHAWVRNLEFVEWDVSSASYPDAAKWRGRGPVAGTVFTFTDIAPHYTSNLQDALELVPGNTDDETINWQIESAGASGFCAEVLVSRVYDDWVHANNFRPQPALALATAAVEARIKLHEE